MLIAVRGYVVPVRDENEKSNPKSRTGKRKPLPRPSREALIFDCETTSDYAQSLRFGTYQCRKSGALVESGIFYETDNPSALSPKDLAVIQRYAAKRGLALRTRQSFVEDIFYRYAYAYGALVVGFNLPFDISRLAISTGTAHARDMRGGFTYRLSNLAHHPNAVIRHLNARASFIRFAATGQFDSRSERNRGIKKQHRTGYFQDVKTLAAALLGKGHTLASLADTLETTHRKSKADNHGCPLTAAYVDYAVNDTQVTWECYEKLAVMYEAHGLKDTPPHRIYSEASLGKAYLNQMGILPLRKMQPDVPPALIGQIMGTYYGGRSEVRIRRQITRVLYCDFRSMYPTVCTLMGLWQFVIAKGFDWSDWTDGARRLLQNIDLAGLQNKDFWKSLTVLVQIAPDDDVLPVRAAYDGKSRTIGLNGLTAPPMWFTLADCIASKLFTGRASKIVSAIRFTPCAKQDNLKPIKLAGDENLIIDPAKGDFFRELIVRRGQLQTALKSETDLHSRDLLDAQQMMLKLVAASTSYGIYAEQNAQSYDRPRAIDLFGLEDCFRNASKSIEEPGTHFHPLIATLITGAARLMLASAECVAEANGIGWAFCDTDSLALARPDAMKDGEFLKRCALVTDWFDRLDPYGDGKPLFKVEDQNFAIKNGKATGKHQPLFALAISAKRYVLFNLNEEGRPVIRKALAHGLGHLMEPYGEKDGPKSIPLPPGGLAGLEVKRWQHDLWYQIVTAFLDGHPDRIDLPKSRAWDRPARSRYGATTSTLLNWFKRFNEGRSLSQQVKSFNFMSAFSTSKAGWAEAIAEGDIDSDLIGDGLPAVVAPYSNDPGEAVANCFDRRTGKPVPASILKTYREAVADYSWHPESKFENGESFDAGITRRRHVEAVAVEYIGKEANRLEEQFYLGEIPEAAINYGLSDESRARIIQVLAVVSRKIGQSALAEQAGITRQELAAILSGHSEPRMGTLRRLMNELRLVHPKRTPY
jgi:DNA-binding phage protein